MQAHPSNAPVAANLIFWKEREREKEKYIYIYIDREGIYLEYHIWYSTMVWYTCNDLTGRYVL